MTPMTQEQKARIDGASYQTLLERWRFAPIGDPMFQGETGEYYAKVLAQKRAQEPDGGVSTSKTIGWER